MVLVPLENIECGVYLGLLIALKTSTFYQLEGDYRVWGVPKNQLALRQGTYKKDYLVLY